MASSRKYRKKWARWQKQYEKYAYKQLRDVFKTWGSQIAWEEMNELNYKVKMAEAVDSELLQEAYYNIYSKIGHLHGNRVGKEINGELKDFVPTDFLNYLTKAIIKQLKLGNNRIVTVAESFFDTIRDLFLDRLEQNKTVAELAKEMQETIARPDFYRWQAMRIARTESTASANHGAFVAGETAGYKMQKVWISANDKRTRTKPPSDYDHYEMNAKRVDYYEFFNVNGDKVMYPGDTLGQAGNVINCRCALAVIPKRDKNGRLIRVLKPI